MSTKKGQHFEEIACTYLLKKGYRLVDRNVRDPFGELDIVVMKGRKLVFVEVKGGNLSFQPRTRVDRLKLKRLELAANKFITDRNPKFEECQLDVIEILNDGTINHLEAIGRW